MQETLRGQAQLAERVGKDHVSTGLQHHRVGLKRVQQRLPDSVEQQLIFGVVRVLRQRQIQAGVARRKRAGVFQPTASEGISVAGIHVQRQRKHLGIVEKSRFHAVAMVRVDVHVQHAPALAAQAHDAQHRVVEIAETQRLIGASMVHAASRIKADTPADDHFCRLDTGAGRGRGHGEKLLEIRVFQRAELVALAHRVAHPSQHFSTFERRHVCRCMEPFQLEIGGLACLHEFRIAERAIGLYQLMRQRHARDRQWMIAAIGLAAVFGTTNEGGFARGQAAHLRSRK